MALRPSSRISQPSRARPLEQIEEILGDVGWRPPAQDASQGQSGEAPPDEPRRRATVSSTARGERRAAADDHLDETTAGGLSWLAEYHPPGLAWQRSVTSCRRAKASALEGPTGEA